MENLYEDYFESVCYEIIEKSNENKLNTESDLEELIELNTIYIGGGTPSVVPCEYIEKILNTVKKTYNVCNDAEITIEVNPGTVDKNKLQKYHEIGINRVSIGLQSADDRLLNLLGRIHTYTEFEETYNNARSVGFKNINVDLMIGLPTQTIEDIEKTLEVILNKFPEHISVYSLILEEDTVMYDLVSDGKLVLPDEINERKMYWKVKEILEKNGYNHYEISNFSKPFYESKHNINCWNQCEYIGIGVAAHSYINKKRFSNIESIKTYINNCKNKNIIVNYKFHEYQNKEDMMKEYMLLGLRKIQGVSISEFKNKFVENPLYVFRKELNKLSEKGLVEINDNYIKLTYKGLDLANIVWMEFV